MVEEAKCIAAMLTVVVCVLQVSAVPCSLHCARSWCSVFLFRVEAVSVEGRPVPTHRVGRMRTINSSLGFVHSHVRSRADKKLLSQDS